MLLASEKENKVFLNAPVVGFRNGKSLKDYQVRAVLTKTNETEICESRGKKTCLFYNSIRTTTTLITKTCGETFIIRSGPLNCNSEKVLYLLKWKVCGEALMLEKPKLSFNIDLITIKVNIELSRKET